MIKCRCCAKTIRGNAAEEQYDATSQTNTYLCKACAETMARARALAEVR